MPYPEKRREPRLDTKHLTIQIAGSTFQVENITVSGLMARFEQAPAFAHDDIVELELIENDVRLGLRGRVAWLDTSTRRFGLEFIWKSEGVRLLVQRVMSGS